MAKQIKRKPIIRVECPICERDGCKHCNYTARVTPDTKQMLIDRKVTRDYATVFSQ